MGNIIIGGIFVVGGLSGQMVLIGTQSSGALVLVGLVLVGIGVRQMGRSGRG